MQRLERQLEALLRRKQRKERIRRRLLTSRMRRLKRMEDAVNGRLILLYQGDRQ